MGRSDDSDTDSDHTPTRSTRSQSGSLPIAHNNQSSNSNTGHIPNGKKRSTTAHLRELSAQVESQAAELKAVRAIAERASNDVRAETARLDERIDSLSARFDDGLREMGESIKKGNETVLQKLSQMDAKLDNTARAGNKSTKIFVPPWTTGVIFGDSNGGYRMIPYLPQMVGFTTVVHCRDLEEILLKIDRLDSNSTHFDPKTLIFYGVTNYITNRKDPERFGQLLKDIEARARARWPNATQVVFSPPPRKDSDELMARTLGCRDYLEKNCPEGLVYEKTDSLFEKDPDSILASSDGIHLNDSGKAILADSINTVLNRYVVRPSFVATFEQFGAPPQPRRGRGRGRGGRGRGQGGPRGGARSHGTAPGHDGRMG